MRCPKCNNGAKFGMTCREEVKGEVADMTFWTCEKCHIVIKQYRKLCTHCNGSGYEPEYDKEAPDANTD